MANKVTYSKPGVYAKGFATAKRNLRLLSDFTELVAKEPCVLPGSKDCYEKDGYSEALWCIPCRARDALKKVNTPITDAEVKQYR